MKKFLFIAALSLGASSGFVSGVEGASNAVRSNDRPGTGTRVDQDVEKRAILLKLKSTLEEKVGILKSASKNPVILSTIVSNAWYVGGESVINGLKGQSLKTALGQASEYLRQVNLVLKANNISSSQVGSRETTKAVEPPVSGEVAAAPLSTSGLPEKDAVKRSALYVTENTGDLEALKNALGDLNRGIADLQFKVKDFFPTKKKKDVSPTPAQTSLIRWLTKNLDSVRTIAKDAQSLINTIQKFLVKLNKSFTIVAGQRIVVDAQRSILAGELPRLMSDSVFLKASIQDVNQALDSLEQAKKGQDGVKTILSDRAMLEELNSHMDEALLALVKAANIGEIHIRSYVEEKEGAVEETLTAADIASVLGGPMNIAIPKGMTPQKEKYFRANLRKLSKVLDAINAKLSPAVSPVTSAIPAKMLTLAVETQPSTPAVREPVKKSRWS